jgi:hypothetical protein
MFAHPRRKPQLPIRLGLFDPPPIRPTWSSLPEEIRRELRTLLVEVLRQHLVSRHGNDRQEGGDE